MTDAPTRLAMALADRYRLERELGQGGMATVYLAHDVRHDRDVAIKVLHPELAAALGAERFLAEIKTTARLQHPHILPLLDSGEADGLLFYVMPFVPGETLRGRLERERQLPIEDALRITREVADALGAAHAQGIVHRDIKPENILLQGGHALVADFGIALAVQTAGGARMTQTGLSLGTPQYMAPEQAMGERTVDSRADLYALGCVAYEMLTGEPPFTGPTVQSIVAKMMTDAPASLRLRRKAIPDAVEAAVLTALEKLPADRFATAAEFVAVLSGERIAPRTGMRTVGRPAVLTTALVLATALALWGWLRPRPTPVPPLLERFTLTFEPGALFADAQGVPLALSPDGTRLVYTGLDSLGAPWLFTRGLERVEPAPISGTRDAIQPFFSPDGQWLGFVQDNRLRKVPVAGGAVVTICELPGASNMNGAAWGPGEAIVFASGGRLYRVASTGGQPTLIAEPDSAAGGFYRWPDVLPDGRHVVFALGRSGQSRLGVLSLDDSTVRELGQAGMSPRWVDGGFLIFTQEDNTLYAAPFDARRVKFTGPPESLAEGVQFGGALVGKMGIARGTGTFAYVEGRVTANELVLLDRQGKEEVLPAPPDNYITPRFSPDGGRIAVAVGVGSFTGPTDLWVYDRATRNRTRLTFDSVSYGPAWEPGGRYLAYVTRHGGRSREVLFRIPVDGSGTPESLLVRPNPVSEVAFTPDRRHLVVREMSRGVNRDIWVVPVDSPAAARPLLRTPFSERQIALSPDGRWLAYVSDEAGSDDVYVRGLEEGSPRWRVSTSGGSGPRWGAGGRELLYRHGDSVYAASVTAGVEFRMGASRALLGGRFASHPNFIAWDVSPDGTRFVFARGTSARVSRELNVVLHWFDRRRAERR